MSRGAGRTTRDGDFGDDGGCTRVGAYRAFFSQRYGGAFRFAAFVFFDARPRGAIGMRVACDPVGRKVAPGVQVRQLDGEVRFLVAQAGGDASNSGDFEDRRPSCARRSRDLICVAQQFCLARRGGMCIHVRVAWREVVVGGCRRPRESKEKDEYADRAA